MFIGTPISPSNLLLNRGAVDGSEFLDGVLGGVEFELDATNINSTDGISATWSNVITSPSSGASQAEYDFTNNGWAFTGVAGDVGAHWLQDTIHKYFALTAGVNTAFIDATHKTISGAPFTFLSVVQAPSVGQIRFFATAPNNGNGYLYQTNNTPRIQLFHVTSSAFNAFPLGQEVSRSSFVLVAASVNPNTGVFTFRVGNTTKVTGTETLTSNTAAATEAMHIGAYGPVSGGSAIGTKMKWHAMMNRVINDSEYTSIQAYISNKGLI